MEKKTTNKTNQVIVERETYEKNGNQYFAYFVKGVVRGKDVKAGIQPTDFGGYTLLDIIFVGDGIVNLEARPFEFKDEKSGEVISGVSYFVVTVDENGEIYECKVKASRQSDKQLLAMILRYQNLIQFY